MYNDVLENLVYRTELNEDVLNKNIVNHHTVSNAVKKSFNKVENNIKNAMLKMYSNDNSFRNFVDAKQNNK